MPIDKLPQVPFGAVYFRKSNPPREDWERDYGVAAEDGLNVFRHWFMWGAIERRPGYYDWDEYDRQMELAAKNGIKTIIAELIHAVPDWAMRTFAHARQVRADGRPLTSNMGVSSATGGFSNNGGGAGALSLNCPEVKEAAGNFLNGAGEPLQGPPRAARLRRLERMQLFAGGRLRQLRQGGVPRLGAGEVRRPRDAEPGLEPLQLQPIGTTSSRRSRWRPIRKCLDWLRVQARQLLWPDAMADRHDPRRSTRTA